MLWFTIVLLLEVTSAQFHRTYEHLSGTNVKFFVTTSQCTSSGTDSDVTFTIGFMDETDKLLWTYPAPAIKGNKNDNLERGTTLMLEFEIPKEKVEDMEWACLRHANMSDQKKYDECFTPNILGIQHYTYFRPASEWKLQSVLWRIAFFFEWDRVEVRSSAFRPESGCAYDWLDTTPGVSAYLKKEKIYHGTYLPEGPAFVPGNQFR